MTGQLYVGMPGNIDNPAAIAITSSTAASPIEIQTSTVHGLTTGDFSGHAAWPHSARLGAARRE